MAPFFPMYMVYLDTSQYILESLIALAWVQFLDHL